MEPNRFTTQGKALSCEVRDIIVEKWFQTIPNSAAVKFTGKDSFKYSRSVRTYRKRSTRSWWEQVTNSKNG